MFTRCEGRASLCHIGSEYHKELKCLNHMRAKDEEASAANPCSKEVVATLDFVPQLSQLQHAGKCSGVL